MVINMHSAHGIQQTLWWGGGGETAFQQYQTHHVTLTPVTPLAENERLRRISCFLHQSSIVQPSHRYSFIFVVNFATLLFSYNICDTVSKQILNIIIMPLSWHFGASSAYNIRKDVNYDIMLQLTACQITYLMTVVQSS